MNKENGKNIKHTAVAALLWTVLLLVLLGGATFAWFTFTSYTNVTPMTGTVGNGGADLRISNSETGPFSNETELIVNGTDNNLQPVSTFNLTEWFSAVSHNSDGISRKFQDITNQINDYSIYGTVYLQSNGGDCDVYFDPENLKIDGDPQLLACGRLALEATMAEGKQTYIFRLDQFVNLNQVESLQTVENINTVVSGIDNEQRAVFETDPSVEPAAFSTLPDSENSNYVQMLFHAPKDEIIQLDWRLYMEGCDENCINTAQDQTINMNLAFTGIGTK